MCTYSVVLGDVFVQSTYENHGHHKCQEKNDQHGVDDGKPMHLQMGGRVVGRVGRRMSGWVVR